MSAGARTRTIHLLYLRTTVISLVFLIRSKTADKFVANLLSVTNARWHLTCASVRLARIIYAHAQPGTAQVIYIRAAAVAAFALN